MVYILLSSGVYISEVVHPVYRGSLQSLESVFFGLGILLCFIFGYLCDWRVLALIAPTPLALLCFSFICLPETPCWLIEHDSKLEAKRALEVLWGKDSPDINHEIELMKQRLDERKNQGKGTSICPNLKKDRHFSIVLIVSPTNCIIAL